jgi:very-short-patch-repair endonuclease
VSKLNIIQGQKVSRDKLILAKTLRHQQTEAEAKLWRYLRRNKVSNLHFRRQQIIDGYVVDFYCHRIGLVIEIDGEIHISQREYDAERQAILESRGLHFLRFTNDVVLNETQWVLNTIKQVCNELTGGT